MPRLLSARFDSVGHRDARLDGLRLGFATGGLPEDSVLWLRNGGGKSSILNLLFSVLRPSQLEFLGSDAEGGLRELPDYVAPDEVAHVALEWRLDARPGQPAPRLITGVCLELRSGEGQKLRRLFYGVRIDAGDALTLDTLPLHEVGADGRKRLLRPNALTERLRELDSNTVTHVTERVQQEWERFLESSGIDPEVFSYQLKMNRREGAADELFRFKSAEEFAEFILDMVMSPTEAERVSEAMKVHRAQLLRRPDLESEHAALQRAVDHLKGMAEVAQGRGRVRRAIEDAAKEIDELERDVVATLTHRQELARRSAAEAEELTARSNTAALRRHQGHWAVKVYELRAAALREAAARSEAEERRSRVVGLEKAARALELAAYVEDRQRLDVAMGELRDTIERTQQQHRPLRQRLGAAARALVGALSREIPRAEERAAAAATRLTQLEEEARDLQKEQAQKGQRLGAVEQALGDGSERMEALRALRNRLVREDVLQPSEPARAAEERHLAAAALEEAVAAERDAEADEATRQGLESGRRAAEAEREATAAAGRRDAHEGALAAARKERLALQDDPALQAALEDPSPDLARLGPPALAMLRAKAARVWDRLVQLRLEALVDQRALESLEKHSLLPPSLDAERVQRHLREAGVNAHCGLPYLAANAPAEEADARIRAVPALAGGVVVPPAELEQAAAVLAGAPGLESPVAVGTIDALLGGGTPGLVALPARASYDATAAIPEREERSRRASERSGALQALTEQHQAMLAVASRLERHLAAHPPDWWDNTERARDAEDRRVAEGGRAAAGHQEAAGKWVKESARLRAAAHDARRREKEAQGRAQEALLARGQGLDGLDQLVRDHAGRIAEREQLRARLEAIAAALERQQVSRDEAKADQAAAKQDVIALTRERLEASALADGSGEAPAEPLSTARERFATLRRQYEEVTRDEILQERLQNATEERKRTVEKLEQGARESGLSVAEIELALAEATKAGGDRLSTWRRAKADLAAASNEGSAAQARVLLVQKELEAAQKVIDEGKVQHRGKVIAEATARCAAWDEQILSQAIAEGAAAVAEAQAEEQRSAELAKEAQERRDQAESDQGDLTGWRKRLGDIGPDVRAIAEVRVGPVRNGRLLDSLVGMDASVDEVVTRAKKLLEEYRGLESEARKRALALGLFAKDAAQAKVPQQLRDRFSEPDLETLLARAGDYLRDVEQRAAVVNDEMLATERQRKLLATTLQGATEPAVKLLERLQKASVFPSSVKVWGDEPFIRVRLPVPESPMDRDAIAANLIDQLVASQEVPSGLKLIKRLLREWTRGRGLRFEILKPEAHRRLVYEPVESLGKFSRGEQLTAAILLYCTLARHRALSRGGKQAASSVLILDNPLGTCSNTELVDLQRQMAAAHSVQLVYTTGIEDLEALARMPNIIRLKNANVDARGRRHVTLDGTSSRPLEAARVTVRANAP